MQTQYPWLLIKLFNHILFRWYFRKQITLILIIFSFKCLLFHVLSHEMRRERTHKTPTPVERDGYVFLLHWCCSYCDSLVALLGVFFGCPKNKNSAITSLESDLNYFHFYLSLFPMIEFDVDFNNNIPCENEMKKILYSITTHSKCIVLNGSRPKFVEFNSKKTDSNHCALRYE